MIGFWAKRVAFLTLVSLLLMLWPQTAKEAADVAAAPEAPVERAAPPSAGASAAPESAAPDAAVSEPAAERAPEPAAPATEPTAPPQPEPALQPEPQLLPQPAALPAAEVDPAELFARLAGGDPTGGATPAEDRASAPEQPTVYLTFDDGPSKLTPQVLDVLEEYGVPATFFVLGKQAEGQEDTIRRIVREGHALGNHTYNHKYDELYGSFASFWEQAERTNDVLERITGERVSLLRAPGGTARNFDAFYFYYVEQGGYKIHDWNVDSGDSRRRGVPASEIVANVKKTKLSHEMNVLLHDGAGHEESVKALPDIIEYFQEKGYRFAALSEETKPITFKVGKPKWKRSVDEAEHERLLALVESQPAVAVLSAEAGEWVSLRAWAKETGASVAWDPVGETATIDVGSTRLYWSVRDDAGWTVDAEGHAAPIDFALELRDERLYAPKASLESLKR